MSRMRLLGVLSLILGAMALALIPAWPALGQEPQAQIVLWTQFPGITIQKGQDIVFPVRITNDGQVGQFLDVAVASAPQGWEARLLDRDYGTPKGVQRVYAKPGPLEMVTIYLRATPPEGVKAGTYEFQVEARAVDSAERHTLQLKVTLEEKMPIVSGKVRLETTYSVLQAPTGESFEYTLQLTNDTPEDLTFALDAMLPQGWELSIQPSYERKQISSVEVRAGQASAFTVGITPPVDVEAGNYGIRVLAQSKEVGVYRDLVAVVTGTFRVVLYTPTGQLNAEATVGQEGHLTIYVANTGSMPLQNLSFLSEQPQNWVVTFNPSRLDLLAPGEVRQLDVALKPASNAIAGDYNVTLRTASDKAQDSIILRVTVGAATVWGWVGLGIVLAVIAGLALVFVRVGRR